MITLEERKLLEGNEYLRANMDKYIEAFVSVYGEDRRQEIVDKFSNITLIGYTSPSSMEHLVSEINRRESGYLQADLLRKCGFDVPDDYDPTKISIGEDSIVKIIFGNTIDTGTYFSLNNYIAYTELFNMGEEGRLEEFKKSGYEFFLRYVSNDLTYEKYEEFFNNGFDFDLLNGMSKYVVDNAKMFLDRNNMNEEFNRKKKNAVEFLNKIGYEVTIENIDELQQNGVFSNLQNVIDGLDEMNQKYQETYSFIKPYLETVQDSKRIEKEVTEKHLYEFLKKIIPYLSEEEQKVVYKGIEKKRNNLYGYGDAKHIEAYFGTFFGAKEIPIGAFSTEFEKILNDPEEREWKKDNIRNSRIKYFNKLGINLGVDYQAYVDSIEALEIWPEPSFADELVELYNHEINSINQEVFESLSFNKEILKEITEKGLLDKDHSFNAELYTSPSTCVNPNIRIGENGPELSSLVLINIREDDALDHLIAHELNHVLELSLLGVTDDHYDIICGWDEIIGEYNQEIRSEVDSVSKKVDAKRDYELFNEIINEMLSQLVSKSMEENNSYIFNSEEKHSYRHSTSYEHTFFIVEDFLREYFDDIVASRQNGNIDIILNKVGKENFDALNELFHVFYSRFSGFKIYGLLKARHEGIVNEDTELYDQIVERRDEILANMREYSLSQESTQKL